MFTLHDSHQIEFDTRTTDDPEIGQKLGAWLVDHKLIYDEDWVYHAHPTKNGGYRYVYFFKDAAKATMAKMLFTPYG